MSGSSASVAIIDIGSNSIKTLVAERAPDGSVRALVQQTLDARISAGISRAEPRLTDESMLRGLAAIEELLALAAPLSPARTILVATSAVRDAQNGDDFRARVRAATGHDIRILTGDEEANLIGRGLTCDPALTALRDFYVFDLGGGSLECLAFRDRRVEQAISLPLGCVRLTERFTCDSALPLDPEVAAQIGRHTATILAKSGFAFSLPPTAVAVATGGTFTTARAIFAAALGLTLDQTDTTVATDALRQLLAHLGALPLAERRQIPGIAAARADVFPTALATLVAVAEVGGFASFRHSFYNLRFGLAAETLDTLTSPA